MAKKRGPEPTPHQVAVAQINELASELAYEVVELNYRNAPGPDLRIANPKNARLALVEVEVTFQQQKSHQRKYKQRYDALNTGSGEGTDVVLVVIGAKRRDLLALLEASTADASQGPRGLLREAVMPAMQLPLV